MGINDSDSIESESYIRFYVTYKIDPSDEFYNEITNILQFFHMISKKNKNVFVWEITANEYEQAINNPITQEGMELKIVQEVRDYIYKMALDKIMDECTTY